MKGVHHGNQIFRDWLGPSALLRIGTIFLFMQIAHAQPAPPSTTDVSGDSLRVTIVGSGGGPQVNLEYFGPSILVQAGSEMLLFDCGRGATIRLTELGIPLTSVSNRGNHFSRPC